MVVSQSQSKAESIAFSEEMASEIESRKVAATATSALIFDRLGNMIEVPERVERIVTLSADVTQILADLGLSDSIIAADRNSASVDGIDPAVCTIDAENPDIQFLAGLSPDVIIVTDDDNDVVRELVKRGLYAVYMPLSESTEGRKMDIEFLAALTGRTEEGRRLIELISETEEVFETAETDEVSETEEITILN
jgi:iron complex transport system substrate-binding protein